MDVDVVIDWFITKRFYNLKWALENTVHFHVSNCSWKQWIKHLYDITEAILLSHKKEIVMQRFPLFHKINMTALSCQWKQSIVDHTISFQSNKSKTSFPLNNYDNY